MASFSELDFQIGSGRFQREHVAGVPFTNINNESLNKNNKKAWNACDDDRDHKDDNGEKESFIEEEVNSIASNNRLVNLFYVISRRTCDEQLTQSNVHA